MKLQPTLAFCVLQVIKWGFFIMLLFGMALYFPYEIVKPILGVLSLILAFIAFYNFLLLRSISYEVVSGQIKYTFGIFSKKIEYLELFRVRDLTQKQGLIDQLISTMSIQIVSDDKSHPLFTIKGVPKSTIAEDIREGVLKARRDNRIFEV